MENIALFYCFEGTHELSYSFFFSILFCSYMFWTDWGETPKIEKCGMNGDTNTRQVLISTNILWPNALAVDYTIDRIWWADAKLHTIESSDLHGKNRRIILSEHIYHPFALTIFQSCIYWTDWHHNAINKANKFTGEERSVVIENLFSPMDIHVHQRQRQPTGRIDYNAFKCKILECFYFHVFGYLGF